MSSSPFQGNRFASPPPRSGGSRAGRWIFRLLLACTALTAALLVAASSGRCQSCLPTFCGHTAECPPGCHCFVPMGGATGHCG